MASSDRLKIRHLHALVAIAEHGTLVRAAEVLSITQPAVSKTLAEFEDIVQVRLFDRTPRGLKLTLAGRTLLRSVGSGLRTIREGLDGLAHDGAASAPTLVIGALPNVAATILPPALLHLADELPHARVTVRTGSNAQLIAALHQGSLDVVIGRLAEPSAMQGLNFEQLYTESIVLAVRAAHPLARRRRIAGDSLLRHRFVLPDGGTRVREAVDRFFLASGFGLPQATIETIDVSFGRSYVLQSDAVWCVPLGVVEDDLAHGTLVRLPVDTRSSEGPVGLTLRVDRAASPAMALLVEQVRKSALQRLAGSPAGPAA